MAPLMYFSFSSSRKVLSFCLFSCFLLSTSFTTTTTTSPFASSSLDHHHNNHELEIQSHSLGSTVTSRSEIRSRRMLLGFEVEEDQEDQEVKPPKKTKVFNNLSSKKNQTNKLLKLNSSSSTKTNQTKIGGTSNITNGLSTKTNKTTKISTKTAANSTKSATLLSKTNQLNYKKLNSSSSQVKKLNSTSSLSKKSNSISTKTGSFSFTKKASLDLIKLGSPKNKTNKPTSLKQKTTSNSLEEDSTTTKKQNTNNQKPTTTKTSSKKTEQKKPSWLDMESMDQEDLITEFRDLPTKFQQTVLPDLQRISITSQKYINRANKEMTKGFKPYVGNQYAPTIASIVSFSFIIIPLILVSLIFNKIKAYFSLQKVLIFINIYLSIYFTILCFSSLLTGLEPLRFFYSTSQSTYVCVMVMQTLGYVLYLLLLLMYLVLVFSTDCGLGLRMLGLVQTVVGFSVGLHYYVAVFHRVVLHQPPKTNWKVHGVYATCFVVVFCWARVTERRKKAYLEAGGEEGKKN